MAAMRQLGRPSALDISIGCGKGRMQTMKLEVTQELSPPRTRRPLRTKRTGRPGGSGAQPPLHLIYMVKVGRVP